MKSLLAVCICLLTANIAFAQEQTSFNDRFGVQLKLLTEQPSLGFSFRVSDNFRINPYYSANSNSSTKVNAAYSNHSIVRL